ncbi:hypothetical protein HWB05_gp170 [Streptomyces phage BRock]|uniref:Ribbon-helix-helix protein CopG domain-containing protein n=1 Tax=Streptomyces phage BRock TaxID=1913591 RepID=A0A1J0GW91_9CAUD|nr:hypothetical protein HWB05_gp170 [Streptomyces phage BRock]APC46444.1 hypothetical protein [Streptomyces phage BRock]
MAVDISRGSMVSRSVRLHEDTLAKLDERAKDRGIGVTVLIRDIVEEYLTPTTVAAALDTGVGFEESAPEPQFV